MVARRVVAECGLGESPLGERIAVRLADVEWEIDELQRIVERVGRTRRDGSLSAPYEKKLVLIREDRAEIRALVDRLVELRRGGREGEERGALTALMKAVHEGRFEHPGKEGDEGEDAARTAGAEDPTRRPGDRRPVPAGDDPGDDPRPTPSEGPARSEAVERWFSALSSWD